MSPATTPAITGKPHWPANPRITSGTANPEVWTQTPNRVSDGVLLWSLSTAANANGPSTQIRASTLVASCAVSLRHSTTNALRTRARGRRAAQTPARRRGAR